MTEAVPDLDPAVAFDTTSAEVDTQIYETLVTYAPGSDSKIVGDLATKWNVSKDGLTYTFHIRSGVKFSNGDPLTAKDFVFELERILDKKMTPKASAGYTFFLNITGAQAYYDGKAKTISGVSTPDDHTLVIHLDKPEEFFLKILAMPFLSAVDPTYVKRVGNAAFDTTKAMGTGPFELVKNDQNQVVLKKNPDYWKRDQYGNQLPYLNRVTINISTNSQVAGMHWEQGQTAFMSPWLQGGDGIPSAQFPTIMNTPKYKSLVTKKPLNSFYYYGMNTKKAIDGKPNPLSNPTVRQALEYAFDDSQIIKINNGAVEPVNQPLPTGIEGHVKNLDSSAKYSLNIAKAKSLLAKAGYKNGFTIDLWDENSTNAMRQDQAFQAMMHQIGVHVVLHNVTWKDFLNKSASGDTQMFASGWQQDFPDASDFLNTLFNSNQIPNNNMTNYSNPQVDSWLNQAEFSKNQSERDALYAKVVNKVMSDAVIIPTYQDIGYWSVQSWVHGLSNPSIVTYDPLSTIWIDPSHH